jgi:hypothetical protein
MAFSARRADASRCDGEWVMVMALLYFQNVVSKKSIQEFKTDVQPQKSVASVRRSNTQRSTLPTAHGTGNALQKQNVLSHATH